MDPRHVVQLPNGEWAVVNTADPLNSRIEGYYATKEAAHAAVRRPRWLDRAAKDLTGAVKS